MWQVALGYMVPVAMLKMDYMIKKLLLSYYLLLAR